MRRIVVIDDDPVFAEMLAAQLAARGYCTRFATSGEEGVRIVTQTLPDAVVCDMRMPEVGGEEVLRRLKSAPTTSHIPIVLMTGYSAVEYTGLGDAFFEKPLAADELWDTLERLLCRNTAPRPGNDA
jgi:CheY-like chemotaxis protein